MGTKRKPTKNRHKISFPAFRLFPVHDYLGIDLLRLMSLANDMSCVNDWMHSHSHVPRTEYAVKIDNMRVSFQHRLWMAFLFQLFTILENMEKLLEFNEFQNILSEEGREALNVLRSAQKDSNSYSVLEKIRHQTVHYDRHKFQKAINALKKRFGEDLTDGFIAEIVQEKPLLARTYYNFASTVRNAVVFGVRPPEELQKEIDQFIGLYEQFYKFIDSAWIAYLQMRKLRAFVKWE